LKVVEIFVTNAWQVKFFRWFDGFCNTIFIQTQSTALNNIAKI
jgi:hypothetical protein